MNDERKPERKVSLVSAVAAVIIAVVAAGTATVLVVEGTTDDKPTPPYTTLPAPLPPPSGTPTPGEDEEGKVGEAVRDGDLEFVVHEAECGREVMANDFFEARAQGEFCVIELSVRNAGVEPKVFDATAQQAHDSEGRQYGTNPRAVEVANYSTNLFEGSNPGNSVRGYIVFDVPKGTALASVELHDSLASPGVIVKLG